jgi:hypothetical protein
MSVIQVDARILNQLAACIGKVSFNKTCDEWFSSAVLRHFEGSGDNCGDVIEFVKDIADMNAFNYSKRYKEECESERGFIKMKKRSIDIYQFLKYLELVNYNTFDHEEEFTQKWRKIAEVLKNLENELKNNIIHNIPAYKRAKWSDI